MTWTSWTQLYYNEALKTLLTATEAEGGLLDDGHRAELLRAIEYLEAGGAHTIPRKLSSHMGGGLFEFRLSGTGGEARVFYCFASGKRVWYLHAIEKKSKKPPSKTSKQPRNA